MIKPLTSLRFVFALMVLLSHIEVLLPDSAIAKALFHNVFSEGFIGVGFFFVLSGFILSHAYQEKFKSNSISSLQFWWSRFSRIYPLHLLTIAMAIPLCFHAILNKGANGFAVFFSNVFLLQSFIPDPNFYFSLNGPAWSLSCELFFYMLFPVVINLLREKKYILWGVILLEIVLVIFLSPQLNEEEQHWFFYINPFMRLADFSLGILLYEVYGKRGVKVIVSSSATASLLEFLAISIFVLFFLFHLQVPLVYRFALYYWIPISIVILTFSYGRGILSEFLSNSIFVTLGEISFGIYLFHNIVIGYVGNINAYFHIIENSLLLPISVLMIVLLLSYLSYHYFEKPVRAYLKSKVS